MGVRLSLFITMFLYYLSSYQLLRFVLVLISICCHYDLLTRIGIHTVQYFIFSCLLVIYMWYGFGVGSRSALYEPLL